MSERQVSSQVEVAVDASTAFRAFTGEMDLWWVRGPINFFDAARAVAKVCEPGVGGRILEVYESGDPLEVARITDWSRARSWPGRARSMTCEPRCGSPLWRAARWCE